MKKTVKKILLADYYGTCDKNGAPVGHSGKVLNEYRQLLGSNFEVSAALSPCLIQCVGSSFAHIHRLKYDIHAENNPGIAERIKDKLKLFENIREVLALDGYDILWFYRTDFFLFLYLCLGLAKFKSKLITQIYQTEFASGIPGKMLAFVFAAGVRKSDGIIYTQRGMDRIHPNTLYMPDYYYDENRYGKYRILSKEDKAVCVGTMNPYKKLEELVEAFNRNGIRLEIKGYFYEKNRYHNLCRMKKDNIVIEDAVLSAEDYYHTLATAKYSVLPYDTGQYAGRTSGVLQESLFVGAIPVAPESLLRENQIPGIGYSGLWQLEDAGYIRKMADGIDVSRIPEWYDMQMIEENLQQFLSETGEMI